MELLTIYHKDFDLFIECDKYNEIWGKAQRNIGEEGLHSIYTWSDGVTKVEMLRDNDVIEMECGGQYPAIFFDNADYPIWVDFHNNKVKNAQFASGLQNENERFTFRKDVLAGFINYKNDIGKSDINLVYQIGDETKHFSFTFEVLSTKLNYHEHWRSIIEDIEKEYRMLSLDYMRRTYHGFSPEQNGETPDIIWWSVFYSEQKKFITSCRNIIDRPHHRLQGKYTYKRADQLIFVPRTIEDELAEHRKDVAHLYRVEESVQTNDTPENRFLKFAICQIADKFDVLKQQIDTLQNISDIKKKEMQIVQSALRKLKNNPFFRTVGHFKGLNQESMVLQKATGYSQVYRTWTLLHRGYSLNDGLYRLQTKDIATLYEIWCFIEVSHIVKEQLHLTNENLEHRNRMEMNGLFTWGLGKGEYSRILFKKDNVELAELVYNPKSTECENNKLGMEHLVVRTVPQKPDIVLQLTKNDLTEGMKFTYLFDAKYRIEGKVNGVDVPPDDAINQMHRYRDAIYYKEDNHTSLKKEIIGGYILFPGDGEPLAVENSRFQKSRKEVNIGAFPLRPKDPNNRKLLERFINDLISNNSSSLMSHVIPQKGTFVDVGNRVLIGLVSNSNQPQYTMSFLNSSATLYYTGAKFPTTIALQNLHFFIPYIKGEGIRDVYEIIKIRTITVKEAKRIKGDEVNDDLRLAFELRFKRKLFANYQFINTHKLINYTFIDTTFDQLDNVVIYDKL